MTTSTAGASVDERAETRAAIRNAAVLAMSLAGSWSISIALRLALPRLLGPERFGRLAFADSFAAMFMVFASLGFDTYVRKVVSIDAAGTTAFLGGALALRAAATGVLLALMAAAFRLVGGDAAPASLVLLAGLAQALLSLNTSLAALMDARGRTRHTAPLGVVAKALHAGGAASLLLLGAGLLAVPLCMLVAEGWRAAVLWRRVSREFPGRWPVDLRAGVAVVVASAPFYLNTVCFGVYGELDLSLVTFAAGRAEAGWYGAANNLTALALMMMPLLGAVVLPAGARAAARSAEEHDRLLAGAWRIALVVSIPLAVVLVAGARDVVDVVFGPAYAPAALPLRLRAPTVVLSYVSTLAAIGLIQTDRTWYVTWTSLAGLVVKPLLSTWSIALFQSRLGDGGAGAGAAFASLVSESLVVALMFRGGARVPGALDLRRAVASVAVPGAFAAALHAAVPFQGLPALAVLLAAYGAGTHASGVLRPASLVRVLRSALARRR